MATTTRESELGSNETTPTRGDIGTRDGQLKRNGRKSSARDNSISSDSLPKGGKEEFIKGGPQNQSQ